MSLWSRVGLIVLGFVAVIVASMLVIGQLREAALLEELGQTQAAASHAHWNRIVSTRLSQMRQLSPLVEQSQQLRNAVAERDAEQIAQVASGVFDWMAVSGDADRMDIVDREGVVVYSSRLTITPNVAASASAVRRMLDAGWRGGGISNDSERNVTLSVGVPIRGADNEVLAVVVYSQNIRGALLQLKREGEVDGLIVNRRGRVLTGTEIELWAGIREQVQLAAGESQIAHVEDRVLTAVRFPLEVSLGTLVASLVLVHDSSAAYHARAFWGRVAFAAIGGFILLSLLGLSIYLHRALAPLSSGVRVLQALAEGDTQVDVPVTAVEGENELGRLARAVAKFRAQTVTLNRHRHTQNLRHLQQERFIRNEMMRLAETLGPEPRQEILHDLADIEKQSAADQDAGGTAAGRDGLLMTGIAFEKMTDRVAAQQGSLTKAIAELQEALKAKTAFLALQKDLEVADRVQRSFLPGDCFESAGVHIQAMMRTAKEVGGDFYDFFALEEGRVGVVIADVAGKGIPAALFMAVTRTLLRAVATRFSKSPGEALTLTNDMLVDFTNEDNFVTVFYGELDQDRSTFRYANGGHNPPVLVRTSGETQSLPLTKGVALAMFPGLQYQESEVELPADGRLFLYTDGVPESGDVAGDEFGEERMIRELIAGANKSSPELIGSMLHAVDEFAGEAEQFDDITMVVMSRG